MISKDKRITTKEFKQYFSKGKKKFTTHFRVVLVKKKSPDNTCFAATISKKIIKSAVRRNQCRRKVYNLINAIYPHICKDYFVFVFIQRDIRAVDASILQKELEEVLPLK